DSGIPPRVARRIPVTQAIVGNLATSSLIGKELSETTDFLFFLETNDFAPQGKIGIVLIEKERDGTKEMEIIEVNPLSDAARSGVQSGDILVKIEDQAVMNMDDIKVVLMNKLVGDTVSIVVKRPLKDNGREERNLDVILIDPENIKPHP
ncbi:MAG: PDZ domain-containing protein, partial [Deltaproteobacteria bacterium]|nr:PDZ domain-containing protein [Deltaproteobacteria bacterium]